jgi:capsular polysaccharide transport system permease protein
MTSIAFFADETRRGLTRQANVVFALIFKEFMGRASSGAGLLGLFWALATPMIYALSLSTMWYLLARHDFYGVSPFLVMTTSIMPYLLVRHSLGHIPGAIGGNMGLYGYPQVKPIDALIARFILDAILILGDGSLLLLGARPRPPSFAAIARTRQHGVKLAADHLFDELAQSRLNWINQSSKRQEELSAGGYKSSGFVVTVLMAWSPARLSKAG